MRVRMLVSVTVAVVAMSVPSAALGALPVVYSSAAADAYGLTHFGGSPTRRQRSELPSPQRASLSGRPRARHAREHGLQLVHALTAVAQPRVLRVRSQLRSGAGTGGRATGTLPPGGTGDIPTWAAQLASFVSQVLAETGAQKVDIVGHSQGGMLPRYYMRFLSGAAKVHTLVGLSPSNHGTTVNGLTNLLDLVPGGAGRDGLGAGYGVSCEQQLVGSPFMARLNAGGDTITGVHYTNIETRYDEVVTPYTSAFLSGAEVRNIDLQQQCPLDASEHLATPFDHIAVRDVLNALDPAHAAAVTCTPVLAVLGG
jgi:pimeloyl-ACP methyl ester carboxylesterase